MCKCECTAVTMLNVIIAPWGEGRQWEEEEQAVKIPVTASVVEQAGGYGVQHCVEGMQYHNGELKIYQRSPVTMSPVRVRSQGSLSLKMRGITRAGFAPPSGRSAGEPAGRPRLQEHFRGQAGHA